MFSVLAPCYHPNLAARSLASADTNTVGVIIGDIDNPFHAALARALDAQLQALGYDSIISINPPSEKTIKAEASRLIGHRVKAAILIGAPIETRALIEFNGLIRSVFIGGNLQHLGIASVSADDEGGARTAVGHLISLGHTHIAHVTGGSAPGGPERLRGYLAEMHEVGLPTHVEEGEFTLDAGHRAADRLFIRKSRPTAIFAANDMIAIGLISRLQSLGHDVPRDVAVIGFDDSRLAATETISLSTMTQDADALARAAIGLITDHDDNLNKNVIVTPHLTERRSTSRQ